METSLLLAYMGASLLIIVSPGPDNLLVVSRGLSQGRAAALTASFGSAAAVLTHSLAAALGLSLLIQATPAAFLAVKLAGSAYLAYLGVSAITARNLISFSRTARLSLPKIFAVSAVSGMLNPKSGLFLLAFLPRFVSSETGAPSFGAQLFLLGCLFAALSVLVFGCLGAFAAQLSRWMAERPWSAVALNVGAGLLFIAVAVSVLLL